jgi:hypothetical protein
VRVCARTCVSLLSARDSVTDDGVTLHMRLIDEWTYPRAASATPITAAIAPFASAAR